MMILTSAAVRSVSGMIMGATVVVFAVISAAVDAGAVVAMVVIVLVSLPRGRQLGDCIWNSWGRSSLG